MKTIESTLSSRMALPAIPLASGLSGSAFATTRSRTEIKGNPAQPQHKMKTNLTLATLGSCLAMIVGCANSTTAPAASSNTRSAPQKTNTIADTPQLRKGMTKAQVITAWGEPSGRQVSGSGEIWTWGGQRWKRMIPYAGPFVNVQTSKVVFGSNGRVKDFRITDRGDAMTDMEGSGWGHSGW